MASVYDRRMEEIVRQRAEEKGERADGEPTGHAWLSFCGVMLIVVGIFALAIPPIGIALIVFGAILLTGTKTVIQPAEMQMYEDVRGKGANGYTIWRLIQTAFAGIIIVAGAAGCALFFAMQAIGR